jgi:hypothetical protein
MVPERVGQEAEAELARLASEVGADLRFVGLPVHQAGDSWKGRGGQPAVFVIYYDPSREDTGGVYVRWSPSAEIKELIVSAPELAEQRALPLGTVTLEVMTDAAEAILGTAGWETERAVDGVHETSLKVSRRA